MMNKQETKTKTRDITSELADMSCKLDGIDEILCDYCGYERKTSGIVALVRSAISQMAKELDEYSRKFAVITEEAGE